MFADKASPFVGPLMGCEVLSAFFLEAGFLGIMLFGRERVGDRLHMLATAIVAMGTLFSAFWIVGVNRWMQTPTGYAINHVGQFIPQDWLKIVFNPSMPYRLFHMVLAACLTTAFVVGADSGWHLLKNRTSPPARLLFSMAVLLAPVQIAAGDAQGLNTLAHQPAKIAAIQGHYEGLPDDKADTTRYAIEIALIGSLILPHDLTTPIPGLLDFPSENRPPAALIFRIMVAMGFAMLGLGLWGAWARWKGALYGNHLLHRAAVLMGPAGFLGVLCGWIRAKVGRQPFTVFGLRRNADSVGPLQAPAVAA